MKTKIKSQNRNIQKKNSTFSWSTFLQISEIKEIREYNNNINNNNKQFTKEKLNNDKDDINSQIKKKTLYKMINIIIIITIFKMMNPKIKNPK